MKILHIMRRIAVATLIAGGFCLTTTADADGNNDGGGSPSYTATIGCDVPQGHVCFFTVFDSAGVPAVFLRLNGNAKTKMPVYGSQSYSYTVTVDFNYSSDPTCRLAKAAKLFCKTSPLLAGYNS